MRIILFVLWILCPGAAFAQGTGIFESPHVHPLELTPGGDRLLAVHTDAHRLVVLAVEPDGLRREASIPVGLEPVTVRIDPAGRAWVVNHLSDTINLVDLQTMTIVATLRPGDEPTDVVFAADRAFVCLSQEDRVVVYDARDPGTPIRSIPIPGSDPRSLAVDAAGSRILVTVHESGNRTTIVPESLVRATLGLPAPDPPMRAELPEPPSTGLIVRDRGEGWRDEAGRSWDVQIPYRVTDHDLVVLDANTLQVVHTVEGLGTTLFNVATHPDVGAVVTAIEAHNEIRFEPNLKGRFAQNRLAIARGDELILRGLNPHLDPSAPGTPELRERSLALPMDVVIAPDGRTIYVAAMGSRAIGVFDADGVRTGRFTVGGGPTGLAISADGTRLFVLERFDDAVGVLETAGGNRLAGVSLGPSPVEEIVRRGRERFYRADDASVHGNLSCATCHVFGGMDHLAWDLGNPAGRLSPAPPEAAGVNNFHPMKGPLMTQSLKGLLGTEPFHWRGDREGLLSFNRAFVSLLGRDELLGREEFDALAAFVFAMQFPPNPYRELDGGLAVSVRDGDPRRGRDFFVDGGLMAGVNCRDCHDLRSGSATGILPGTSIGETQPFNMAQLRNLYEKVGFDRTQPETRLGFGFIHDGSEDGLLTFLRRPEFDFADDKERRDVRAFLMSFGEQTLPAQVWQRTWSAAPSPAESHEATRMEAHADVGQLGLIARSVYDGEPQGWWYAGAGRWLPDRAREPAWSRADLMLAASEAPMTWSARPVDGARRDGIDADGDGHLDGDERDAGSDPGDAASVPRVAQWEPGPLRVLPARPNPVTGGLATVEFSVEREGPVEIALFDLRGRRVRVLFSGTLVPRQGLREVQWDLHDDRNRRVPSGVYFLRFEAYGKIRTQRLVVL